jgi:arylsulfatase A
MKSILITLACLLLSTAACVADDASRPPNVVLFLVDDMGWSDLGCYGNRFHETPHIDALAQRGLRFTDAYAACPVCSPTRASIVTGRYPATVGLTDFISGHWRPYAKTVVPRFHHELPHDEVTFAEFLKPRGYVSGSFGKWHLGGPSHDPDTQGFDEWVVTAGRHFAPNFRIRASSPFPAEPREYYAEYLTRRAEKFLEDRAAAAAEEPFVLYLPHYAVHIPLEAEQRLVAKYEAKLEDPRFAPTITATLTWPGGNPESIETIVEHLELRGRALEHAGRIETTIAEGHSTTTIRFDPAVEIEAARKLYLRNVELISLPEGVSLDVRVTAVNNPVYAAMCEHVDESLGRILAKLDALKLADDTLVIVFSDNGGLYRRFDDTGDTVSSQHPLRGEKGSLYEGGIRVPCIVRWPGVVAPGTTCSVPISSVDLFPTMAEAAGLEVPANVDGKSLVPLLKGADTLGREAIYWHYPHYHHTTPAGAIRAGRYKLIEFFEDARLELYDLETDIGERHDLSASHPDRAIELRRNLAEWRTKVGAKLPTPNPDHDPARAAEWGNRRDRGF